MKTSLLPSVLCAFCLSASAQLAAPALWLSLLSVGAVVEGEPPTQQMSAGEALDALLQHHAERLSLLRLTDATPEERHATDHAFIEDIEGFLNAYPGSPWDAPLRLGLGIRFQREARWSRALPYLFDAWEGCQSVDVETTPRLLDRKR